VKLILKHHLIYRLYIDFWINEIRHGFAMRNGLSSQTFAASRISVRMSIGISSVSLI
jgi:hypothetical protein